MSTEKTENHLEVVVVTTSGSWPSEGFETIPIHQKIRVALVKAAESIKIVSTVDWIAKVNGKIIDTELNYEENDLSGKISIDFGPSEGGGGK